MPSQFPAITTAGTACATAAVRVVTIEGQPWFVAADVCRAIGLAAYEGSFARHLRRLDDDEITVVSKTPVTIPGTGMQSAKLVNESGLYALILQSRKPEAQRFRKWVTSEVLPAIRRDGMYLAPAVAQQT